MGYTGQIICSVKCVIVLVLVTQQESDQILPVRLYLSDGLYYANDKSGNPVARGTDHIASTFARLHLLANL